MCDQQSLRSACAYAQSDQSLCSSLDYSMTVKLLTEHHLEFLSLKGNCTGSIESTLVKMPHCWKSRVTAQFIPHSQPKTEPRSAVGNVSGNRCESDCRFGVPSSIPARSHTFVEIDYELISTVILLPSAESFKKGCCQLQAKVCARSTG